jgi:hypothetical protein
MSDATAAPYPRFPVEIVSRTRPRVRRRAGVTAGSASTPIRKRSASASAAKCGLHPMKCRQAVRTAMQLLEALAATSRKLGPDVLIEVLLPGGTLIAMMVFAYRHPATALGYVARARRAAMRIVAAGRDAIATRAAKAPPWTMGIETAVRALG